MRDSMIWSLAENWSIRLLCQRKNVNEFCQSLYYFTILEAMKDIEMDEKTFVFVLC